MKAKELDEENEPLPAHRGRHPRKQISTNLDELEYFVNCAAFDEKKVWFVGDSYRLGTFKLHEFNAKAIMAVDAMAERMKAGSELATSCVVTTNRENLKV